MCVFRFTIVNAMIHASETGDKEWQHALWSPSVFSFSQPVRHLGYCMKVARSFSSLTMTGTDRAEPIADAENGVTGWKLSTREHPELVVLKSDLVTGVRNLCADAQQLIGSFLGQLQTLAGDDVHGNILQQHIFRQEDDLESAISELPMAFFGRPVAFENGKSKIQFRTSVITPTLENLNKRKPRDVYGKMMGTTFFLSDNTTLDSCALAEAITAVLIHEKNDKPVQAQKVLKQFDDICAELLDIVLTLLQWSVRGRPREGDWCALRLGGTLVSGDGRLHPYCHVVAVLQLLVIVTVIRIERRGLKPTRMRRTTAAAAATARPHWNTCPKRSKPGAFACRNGALRKWNTICN